MADGKLLAGVSRFASRPLSIRAGVALRPSLPNVPQLEIKAQAACPPVEHDDASITNLGPGLSSSFEEQLALIARGQDDAPLRSVDNAVN